MDPFTLATGFVGIFGLCIQISHVTEEYISHASSAPKEIQDLNIQLKALADVWEKLDTFLKGNAAAKLHFQPTSGLYLLLKSCLTQLESLQKKLGANGQRREANGQKREAKGPTKETPEAEGRTKKLSIRQRLLWPLKANECVETTRRLYECSQAFQFCLVISNW